MLEALLTCTIYFADDLGARTAQTIIAHEQAHCVCPTWRHAKTPTFGPDIKPPPACTRKFRGRVVYRPMTTSQVLNWTGHLGYSEW